MTALSTRLRRCDAVVAIGAGVGLSLPLLDLLLAAHRERWLAEGLELAPPWVVFASMSAFAAVTLAAYAVAWLVVALPLRRALGLAEGPLAAAVGGALALAGLAFVAGLAPPGDGGSWGRAPGSPALRATVLALSCAAAAVAAYAVAADLARRPRARALAASLGLLAPFALAGGYAVVWFQSAGRVGALGVLAALAVAGAVALGAFVLLFRSPRWRARAQAVLVAGAAALLALPWLAGPAPEPAPRALSSGPSDALAVERILLVSIDTLRRDALSCYGGGAETPHLDALAADSVVFDDAVSCAPWTVPSVASILTGLNPWVHGVLSIGAAHFDQLDPLAARLARAGYRTKSIGNNAFLAASYDGHAGIQHGFDEATFAPKRAHPETIALEAYAPWAPPETATELSTDDISDLAVDWIERNADAPFFLWLHWFDPHGPYAPPEEFVRPSFRESEHGSAFQLEERSFRPFSQEEEEWIRELYHAEVRYVDERVGAVIEALKERGLYEDALVVFTSDHGEELMDHGWIDHGHTLYEELLSVPLFVKLPGSTATGRVPARVTTDGVLPTILDVARVPYAPEDLTGVSLAPLWREGGAELAERPAFGTGIESGDKRESVTFRGMKYVRDESGGTDQLFDLRADPGELHDLSDEHPALVKSANELLDRHRAQCAELRRRRGIEPRGLEGEVAPGLRRLLETLGYLK